jgi:ferredoxin
VEINVDYRRCTGNGFCEGITADVFEVAAHGQVGVLMRDVPEDRREQMQKAVDWCPTDALSIKD